MLRCARIFSFLFRRPRPRDAWRRGARRGRRRLRHFSLPDDRAPTLLRYIDFKYIDDRRYILPVKPNGDKRRRSAGDNIDSMSDRLLQLFCRIDSLMMAAFYRRMTGW